MLVMLVLIRSKRTTLDDSHMDAHTSPKFTKLEIILKLKIQKSSWTPPPINFISYLQKFSQLGFDWTPPPPNWDNVLKSASFYFYEQKIKNKK